MCPRRLTAYIPWREPHQKCRTRRFRPVRLSRMNSFSKVPRPRNASLRSKSVLRDRASLTTQAEVNELRKRVKRPGESSNHSKLGLCIASAIDLTEG